MIIPYYNSLIVKCQNGKVDHDLDDSHKMAQYFQEFFSHCQLSKDISINIQIADNKNQSVMTESMIKIIRQVLFKLKWPLFEIYNTYTFNKEIYCLHEGLLSLTFIEGENSKAPASINNLTKLKEYYLTYKSERQMKDFLKSVLISSINHEKRLIKYSKVKEIQIFIKKMMQDIRGNIRIISNQKMVANSQNIWIIMTNENHQTQCILEQLIKTIENKFDIDKSINKGTTHQYTIKHLQKRAQERLYNILYNAYQNDMKLQLNQAMSFSKNLSLMGILRDLFRYGSKLAEQERILKEQFLAFVQEMNIKYSGEIKKYLTTFRQKLGYQKQIQSYKSKQAHTVTMNRYCKGFITSQLYKADYRCHIDKKCCKIQKRVRTILLKKRLYEQMMEAYLFKKQVVRTSYKSNYTQIKDICNDHELKKLLKFNKYKYGFSCCLHILDIDSRTNYCQFQPTSLCSLIQKANKHKDLFTKIYCEQNYIQIHNIEGKIFRLGEKNSWRASNPTTTMPSNKQNQNPNQHKFKQEMKSFKSSMKSSRIVDKNKLSRSTQFSSRISLLSGDVGFSQKDMICERKRQNIQKGEDFEFKIDQYSKLYGRGSNFYGQLGIGNHVFAEQFTNILPMERIKLVSTSNYHSVAVTNSNKIYHFGRQKDGFEQSFIPIQVNLKQKIIIRDVLCTYNDTYLLTDHNKVYSMMRNKFIRIPKQIELQFDEFRLIKSGGPNMEIVYIVGYWINCLDKAKKQQIVRYLTKNIIQSNDAHCQSMLIQDEGGNDQPSEGIHQLSAILEQSCL